jgi:hypothetical protein
MKSRATSARFNRLPQPPSEWDRQVVTGTMGKIAGNAISLEKLAYAPAIGSREHLSRIKSAVFASSSEHGLLPVTGSYEDTVRKPGLLTVERTENERLDLTHLFIAGDAVMALVTHSFKRSPKSVSLILLPYGSQEHNDNPIELARVNLTGTSIVQAEHGFTVGSKEIADDALAPKQLSFKIHTTGDFAVSHGGLNDSYMIDEYVLNGGPNSISEPGRESAYMLLGNLKQHPNLWNPDQSVRTTEAAQLI